MKDADAERLRGYIEQADQAGKNAFRLGALADYAQACLAEAMDELQEANARVERMRKWMK